jgi:hypothetical protein
MQIYNWKILQSIVNHKQQHETGPITLCFIYSAYAEIWIFLRTKGACLCDVVLLAQLPVSEGEDDLLLLLRLVVQVPAAQHQSSLILPIIAGLTQSHPAYHQACLPVLLSLILPRHPSWWIQHRLYPAGTSLS